ncbi:hypothetical protein D3C87_1302220 [compost metagenome]
MVKCFPSLLRSWRCSTSTASSWSRCFALLRAMDGPSRCSLRESKVYHPLLSSQSSRFCALNRCGPAFVGVVSRRASSRYQCTSIPARSIIGRVMVSAFSTTASTPAIRSRFSPPLAAAGLISHNSPHLPNSASIASCWAIQAASDCGPIGSAGGASSPCSFCGGSRASRWAMRCQ